MVGVTAAGRCVDAAVHPVQTCMSTPRFRNPQTAVASVLPVLPEGMGRSGPCGQHTGLEEGDRCSEGGTESFGKLGLRGQTCSVAVALIGRPPRHCGLFSKMRQCLCSVLLSYVPSYLLIFQFSGRTIHTKFRGRKFPLAVFFLDTTIYCLIIMKI